jgi:Ca2+-binding RTX toxin-like protein
MTIESLESRRLLSVSLNSATHVLTINGTANDDTITVAVVVDKVVVTDNGVVSTFARANVSRVVAFANAGADQVTIQPSVFIPTTLYSGPGDDLLKGGSASGQYSGGTGADTIDYSAATGGLVIRNGTSGSYFAGSGTPPTVVGDGADVLSGFENFTGGAGNDYIYGTVGVNVIKGNGGNDYIRAAAGNDTIYAREGESDFISGGIGTDQARKDPFDTATGVEIFLS